MSQLQAYGATGGDDKQDRKTDVSDLAAAAARARAALDAADAELQQKKDALRAALRPPKREERQVTRQGPTRDVERGGRGRDFCAC